VSDYNTAFDAEFPGVRADIERRFSEGEASLAAELAALEHEIGRAYLAHRDTEDFIFDAECRREADVDVIAYRAAERRIIEQETALDALITRYRELHAAGEK